MSGQTGAAVPIETERLQLRRLGMDDLDEFVALHTDPEVTRFIRPLNRAEAAERLEKDEREWRERGHGLLAIAARRSGAFLGRCGLKRWPQFGETELGWALRRDAWGHGYATEAARACIEWGFAELDVPYLTAMIAPGNSRSLRVAERLGLTPMREDVLLGEPVVVHAVHRDEPIRIVSYDREWPQRFEVERELLEGAIGGWVSGGIHHVGSTAVPGLDAKPVIDILAGVESLDGSRGCFEPLAELGYVHAPYLADEMHWFCKPDPRRRTHHLHLVPTGSARFRDELAFRDLLRRDPETAQRYAELKRDLAARFADDREAYTEAKTPFIRDALATHA